MKEQILRQTQYDIVEAQYDIVEAQYDIVQAQYDMVIVGGGAAGFFTAINAAMKNPDWNIVILEKNRETLQKVKVSGGGRCNVTHACFEPEKLIKFYPRGEQILLEPFQRFNPTHTIQWFENQGVRIKKEADGRMFPVSNSSQTIIDCFLRLTEKYNIEVRKSCKLEHIAHENNIWNVKTTEDNFQCKRLAITTGSSNQIWEMLRDLGLTIIQPVPSLFTFTIRDNRIADLMGLSVPTAILKVNGTDLQSEGAMLITHWGLSGPAVLRLSAWGARELNKRQYEFKLSVNWLGLPEAIVKEKLHGLIEQQAKKNVIANAEFGLPIRLWKNICQAAEVSEHQKWAETGKKHIQRLTEQLTKAVFEVKGKSTFKDEFVTAGGVDLSEIDFQNFSSKKYPTLHLAGEVLDIDAITGGFNFQAAWTGGYLIST